MSNKKLIYASAARGAILKADPKLAYCIDSIPGVDAVVISPGVTVQEWISVKDRLPDLELDEAKSNDCDFYVCLTAKRGFANKDQIFIIKAWYYRDRFENDDGIDITDDVTHWMPLPQPPKGE